MGGHEGGNWSPCKRNYGPQGSEWANPEHSVRASSHRCRLQLVKWQVMNLSVSLEASYAKEEEEQKILLSIKENSLKPVGEKHSGVWGR